MGRQVDLAPIRKRRDDWFAKAQQADGARNQQKAQLEAIEEEIKRLGEMKLDAISRWQELNTMLADMDPDGEEAKNRETGNAQEVPKEGGEEEVPAKKKVTKKVAAKKE